MYSIKVAWPDTHTFKHTHTHTHTLFECTSEMARVAQVKWRMFAGASVQVNKFFIEINLRQQEREIVVERGSSAKQTQQVHTHTRTENCTDN